MCDSAEVSKPRFTNHLRWKWNSISFTFISWWRNTCDWLKWLGHREGNLEKHARRELEIAGMFDSDSDYGGMLGNAVMRMMREFSEEGHSGFSASLTTTLFEKVSRFEPLTPLTGEDDEWNLLDYSSDTTYQNKRCSHVFKDKDNRAYDIEGKIFREPDGGCYTGKGSRVFVDFPYTPTSEYVDVKAN